RAALRRRRAHSRSPPGGRHPARRHGDRTETTALSRAGAMREPIDEQLRRRREVLQPVRRFPGLRGSLALHVAAVLLFVVAPRLFGQAPEPIEYVAVQILPLQALGERRARPAPAPE